MKGTALRIELSYPVVRRLVLLGLDYSNAELLWDTSTVVLEFVFQLRLDQWQLSYRN